MGTHAMIGIWNNETGEVTASYVHYDGYIDGVGAILTAKYNDPVLAKMVAIGGYLSSLCGSYIESRMASVHCTAAEKYESVEEYLKEGFDYAGAQYIYLFDGDCWFAAEEGEKFTDVETLLGK